MQRVDRSGVQTHTDPRHAARSRAIGGATAFVLLLGLARMTQVALHSPLLGYGNNWDFIKLSSTVGIWVDEPGVDRYAGHPSGPYSRYRSHGELSVDRRYLSSELLLVYPAIFVSDVLNRLRGVPRTHFDLRTLGAIKVIFFFIAGAFLSTLFFHRSAWLGLLSALIFAAVICDPINTLYFNTLYLDDSAVLFTYLAVGTALLLISARSPPPWLMAAFCIALVLAGWSKLQHPGLPLALVLGYVIAQGRWGADDRAVAWRLIPPLVAALITLALASVYSRSRSLQGMAVASSTDVWFHMTLPSVRNPDAVLDSIGIPARCRAYIGKSWFHPGMDQLPCPEIFRLSRFQMVRTLLNEPPALGRILVHAVTISRPSVLDFGHVEGRSFVPAEAEGLRFSSMARLVDHLPPAAYAAWVLVSLVGGSVSLIALLVARPVPGATFCLLLNAVFAATLLASLLGDGFVDFARHMYLGHNALLISPVAAMVVVAGLRRRVGRRDVAPLPIDERSHADR